MKLPPVADSNVPQIAAAVAVMAFATVDNLVGAGVSDAALFGLYGTGLGYIFGYRNGSNSPRQEWTDAEREAIRIKARVNQ